MFFFNINLIFKSSINKIKDKVSFETNLTKCFVSKEHIKSDNFNKVFIYLIFLFEQKNNIKEIANIK